MDQGPIYIGRVLACHTHSPRFYPRHINCVETEGSDVHLGLYGAAWDTLSQIKGRKKERQEDGEKEGKEREERREKKIKWQKWDSGPLA